MRDFSRGRSTVPQGYGWFREDGTVSRIGITVLLLVGLISLGLSASASHAPNTYCSESGDVCNSTRKDEGKRMLRIVTAANYFDTYRVCVMAPDDTRACRQGVMRENQGVWIGSMAWAKRFPKKGPGAYSVRWSSGDGYKSPRLGFHVKG